MSSIRTSPEDLVEVLQEIDYKVIHESEYHWFMAKQQEEPIVVPKEPSDDGFVDSEILDHIMFDAQLSHHKFDEIREKLRQKRFGAGSGG